MPVFKSYENNKGNYIYARPSDTGNVTYQVTPKAEDFIQKLGYTDDDNLPWGIINPLRAAGFIYTEEGTEPCLDDAPELDPSELVTISADEAEKLLSYLQSRGDVPDEIHEQLRETIEESQTTNNDMLESDNIDSVDEEQLEAIISAADDIQAVEVVSKGLNAILGDESKLSGNLDTSDTSEVHDSPDTSDSTDTYSYVEAWTKFERKEGYQELQKEAGKMDGVNGRQSKDDLIRAVADTETEPRGI
jgi:hypothetical protein